MTNATWKYNKQSAYALQHDDYCAGTQGSIDEIVVLALLARDLTASFGVIAKTCWGALWGKARSHVEAGFTRYHYSMHHTPAFKPSWEKSDFKVIWDNKRDITDANKRIKDKTGYTPTLMAMPYDIGSDESYQYVRDHPELIAMRAPVENNGVWVGNVGVNSKNFHNSYKLKVEIFHKWSPYWKLGKNRRLAAFLNDTIEREGFGLQYFHGVADESYVSIAKSEYLNFLDKLKKASDEHLVWVADASEIVNYRFAREYCSLVETSQTEKSRLFSVQGTVTKTDNCTNVDRELTAMAIVTLTVSHVKQGGADLVFTQIDGVLQFEYQINKGDVEVVF
ncbi:hypothetical protein [Psychromonas hadalis]|uniref:hypothetical protein n=1 Tax=Psychromonas hadalis TaxID=211669 RepID=UPI0003B6D1C5|nr:hypothetical protein [Psychromonas hadalis]